MPVNAMLMSMFKIGIAFANFILLEKKLIFLKIDCLYTSKVLL